MSNQFMLFTENMANIPSILEAVKYERDRQRQIWGIQSHGINSWMMILGEEFGEACKAGNEAYFREGPLENLRKELIQTIAVAVAIIESLDDVILWRFQNERTG